MSQENDQTSTIYQNYSSFSNAISSYTSKRLLNIRDDYEQSKNLPRITKHSLIHQMQTPINSYLEKHNGTRERFRSVSRSNNKASEFKSPITPRVPLQIYNYNHNHSNSIGNKSQFHNTFNRNFYNTKFVYNAFKSNIYKYNDNPDNDDQQQSKCNQVINSYNHFDQTRTGFKRPNEPLYPYQLCPTSTKVNFHKTAIDCSQTTNNNNTPTRLKIINIKRNHHRYSLGKRFAHSKAGKDYTGYTKVNQDSFLMKDSIINDQRFTLMGVFDGHGTYGHNISRAIKAFFDNVDYGLKTTVIGDERTTEGNRYKLFDDGSYSYIHNLFMSLTNHVQSNKSINMKLSGSTCVVVFISNEKIICANCGDSRAIIIQENGTVKPLSRDHKPDLIDERHRIEKHGGRIERSPCFQGKGPYRVWLPNEPYPGLAMSRSIGDQIAKNIGVTAEPEIKEFRLEELTPKILIIASDGVWEFLSNDQVANIVIPFYVKGDCEGASKELVAQATQMWENENIKSIDDITAIVAFF